MDDVFQQVRALPNGAKFFRGDLHIHSVVGSHDVSDAAATPEGIIATAMNEGLSIIAIADHNEISGVAPALAGSDASKLLVVPAVELSTSDGHLLCYLPTLEALQKFTSQLTLVDRGTANSRCQTAMLECLDKLTACDGFAILAHVDSPKGLEIERPGGNLTKGDIVAHPALLGIELTNASSPVSFGEADPDVDRKSMGRERLRRGKLKTSPLARVLNSDSHTLNALGRNAAGDNKVTRYKMQSLSFDALRIALVDSDARVRLEDEVPRTVAIVDGLQLNGGFLKDQTVHFSPNLNCIIGGRGAGKSTMFEALRAFSHTPSQSTIIDSDVWPDRIDLAFTDEAKETHRLARSKGDLEAHNLFEPLEGPDRLPIECYGQGETQKISQQAQTDPSALLAYLDRFVDVAKELAAEEDARSKIIELDGRIQQIEAKVGQIPQLERDLSVKRKQLAKLKEGKATDIIKALQQLQSERQSRADLLERMKEIKSGLSYDSVKRHAEAMKTIADPQSLVVGKDAFVAIKSEVETFEAAVATSEADFGNQVQKLGTVVKDRVNEWSAKEASLLSQVEAQKAALEAQGVVVDTAYITRLTQDEARLTSDINNLNAWKPQLRELQQERQRLMKDRWAARSRVSTRRQGFATKATQKLREALTDLNVTLKFDSNAYSPFGNQVIVEVMGWRTNQVPRAAMLTEQLTLPELLKAITAKDPKPIQSLLTKEGVAYFAKGDADEIIKRFGEAANFQRLETAQVFDRPRLTVTKAVDDGSGSIHHVTREFGQLSLGQQQSVLLSLMLSSDSAKPLLIDQPEDNLDSEFIYSTLVPVLRLAKERRQIIVVTHNPNIAVLGDAEQIIVLKATSERAKIVSRGSIDEPQTRDAACSILEGAREAFTRRGRVYGLL